MSEVMKQAKSYFSDQILKQYRDDVLPILKSQKYQCSDFDYIYHVLMDAN